MNLENYSSSLDLSHKGVPGKEQANNSYLIFLLLSLIPRHFNKPNLIILQQL